MKFSLLVLSVSLFLALPILAQTTPKGVVEAFYKDYGAKEERLAAYDRGEAKGWLSWLMKKQAGHVETKLSDYLLKLESSELADRGPFLNADAFNNGYGELVSYTVKEPVMKDGLAYVPVTMFVGRGKGPEVERLRIVLRDSGEGWKIANVVYPALQGQPAWNLMDELKKLLDK